MDTNLKVPIILVDKICGGEGGGEYFSEYAKGFILFYFILLYF